MNLRYGTKALGSLARHLRHRDFAKQWLTLGLSADIRPKAQREFVFFVYPQIAEHTVPMGEVVYRPFNLDPLERFCIGALAQTIKARRIFEFGTYDGSTALLLARSVPDAEVLTLDLPAEMAKTIESSVTEEQVSLAGGIGSKFRGEPECSRITQLLGDSRNFDFSPYAGTVDFVLVDGSHEYESVRSDSINALLMLTPGGIIAWDDYAPEWWPDVVRAVDDVAVERGITVTLLQPSQLVVFDSSRQMSRPRGA